MRKARWLADWRHSHQKPVFYHCISRIVDRRFILGPEEKEKFRALMRIYEKFSGCRVVAYCLMDNHFHLLLEIPPLPQQGLSDHELLHRLSALYHESFVSDIARQLSQARLSPDPAAVREIHERFTYRMHDLGQFMKGLLQRYTQWHNRIHQRRGRLWEDRFKSVIVEDGLAARTMAAYIDLNPVRAGMVKDPSLYRWSSYGEAIGGNPKSQGKTARAGLVRAWAAHQGTTADASLWTRRIARAYRKFLLGNAIEPASKTIAPGGAQVRTSQRKGISPEAARQAGSETGEIPFATMLRCRIRYFTDGAVIGSRAFVDEAFRASRDRFGPKRRSGARRMRGKASIAQDSLWTFRDLRNGIT